MTQLQSIVDYIKLTPPPVKLDGQRGDIIEGIALVGGSSPQPLQRLTSKSPKAFLEIPYRSSVLREKYQLVWIRFSTVALSMLRGSFRGLLKGTYG